MSDLNARLCPSQCCIVRKSLALLIHQLFLIFCIPIFCFKVGGALDKVNLFTYFTSRIILNCIMRKGERALNRFVICPILHFVDQMLCSRVIYTTYFFFSYQTESKLHIYQLLLNPFFQKKKTLRQFRRRSNYQISNSLQILFILDRVL